MIISSYRDVQLKPFLHQFFRGRGTVATVQESRGHVFFCVTNISGRANGEPVEVHHLNLAKFSWMLNIPHVSPGDIIEFSGLVECYSGSTGGPRNRVGIPRIHDLYVMPQG